MPRPPRKKPQLTREHWIAAAGKVLVASGVDDVKIDRLAKKLKVTRGSFYWHFADRKDLLDALLERWRNQNAAEMAQVRERLNGAASDRLFEVVRIWLTEDAAYPPFDMAVRFWARKAPPVARLVRSVDEDWISLLQSIFQSENSDPLEVLARARIFYFHQIGYYALGIIESLDERLKMSSYYHRVLVGQEIDPKWDALTDEIRRQLPSARNPRARKRVI